VKSSNGAVCIVSASTRCATGERKISWGASGARGAEGAPGARGPTGAVGPQGPAGKDGAPGAQGPVGPTGGKGPTGARGPTGSKGTTGAQGVAGAKGATGQQGVAGFSGDTWFAAVATTVTSGQCLAFEGDNHATCPSTAGLPADVLYTLGPVPNGGTTISNLDAQLDANAAGSGNKVAVLDNGVEVLSCTVTSGHSTCVNAGSVAVAAGHYLQVQVTNLSGSVSRKYRVSFRA